MQGPFTLLCLPKHAVSNVKDILTIRRLPFHISVQWYLEWPSTPGLGIFATANPDKLSIASAEPPADVCVT